MQKYFIEQASAVDPREPKLPAWVREKLDTMRRAVLEALAEVSEIKSGGKPGAFWLESWEGNDRYYLPENSGRLMFGDPSGAGEIMLTAGASGRPDGWLNLNGKSGDAIVASPYASNVLLVKTGQV